ncbi:bifunctional hydroxymethylpyrimidine kinase/phosphomethylpyrimidine kinase [Mucilaginibacter sp. JRF]|uniref:PfkB family carbohydrate kinase n=1 Tax=Mucilaginibacter sp. JRF TaxID=2780088 RepID=UPI001880A339|nr:PfkB family carbohydrate kinase [Mucilaginibacter sp. JRF]MBE9585337.1 bifunctional hydroxymethylpyrimidine kinase/phosphomethylpyrimidine kinase [Mucilaginibacter sp. JRF]
MSTDNKVYDICCIGHITHDKVVTPQHEVYMPGGTAFYFSHAVRQMPVSYKLITALAQEQIAYADGLQQIGIELTALPSQHTVYFENSYAENSDHRTQRVLQKADAFTVADVAGTHARFYHLGPLLADDIDAAIFKELSAKGTLSLDAQGLLREVVNMEVKAIDWADKATLLPYVHILKANEYEVAVLTGTDDIQEGAKILAQMGVKEVVITLGTQGSIIYADGEFHTIPVYRPEAFKDATGCGDTYMAGYLYKRATGAGIEDAGHFASAMAGLKAGISGAFKGTEQALLQFMGR